MKSVKETQELAKWVRTVWQQKHDAGETDLELFEWFKQAIGVDDEKETV